MKYVITAGGTGGHIFPALSVYEKIMSDPNNECLYIGTTDRMESKIVPEAKIPYESLEMSGFSKNIFKNFKTVKQLGMSYKKAKSILMEYKPDYVIGFGGYVSFPVIYAAHKLGIKTSIHEQNYIPGKANKMLGKYSDKIFVSFKDTAKYFDNKKVVYSGNPCEERATLMKKVNKKDYGFDSNKKLIIFVMGSLGSTSVDEKVCSFFRTFSAEDKEILYITGSSSYAQLHQNLIVPSNVKLLPFVKELPGLMKSADLIISRAGASTISEILATKIPSIIVPSPYVANNHQYYNGKTMQDEGYSIMIEEKDLNEDVLNEKIKELLDNKETLNTIKDNLNKYEVKRSSTIIFEEVNKL